MWKISDEQAVIIQNRMADVREVLAMLDDTDIESDSVLLLNFTLTVGELLGTLDTVMMDERNYCGEKDRKQSTID